MIGARSRSVVADPKTVQKGNAILPPLTLFDDPQKLTGSEYRFFEEMMSNNKKKLEPIKEKAIKISAKPILQN